jgi:ERCC4-related helicase
MERNRLCKALRDGKINYLFVVDMFNEGVDIPDVDTILFLRPTESLTIFLQQLGRGLRKAKGKPYVNILDFVGQCRDEFDYTDRFRAIIGRTSMSIKEELERGFPHTPFGCQIQLEPKAREYILNNINHAIKSFGLRSFG